MDNDDETFLFITLRILYHYCSINVSSAGKTYFTKNNIGTKESQFVVKELYCKYALLKKKCLWINSIDTF